MKSLSKRISRTSKSALLFSLLTFASWGQVKTGQAPGEGVLISSDRYLMKILDRTLSTQDVGFQLRNLKSLQCFYEDSLVIQYFGLSFVKDLDAFMKKFPDSTQDARTYLHSNEEMLKKMRLFFKMLRYSEDQKTKVTPELAKIIREGTQENRCGSAILYKEGLKTNFIILIQMELYLRSRYGGQLKSAKNFDVVRPSVDLFTESLDKQFPHEYYW